MDNLDYGIIGNCKSAALISKTGSLDWCCLPNFNSAAIFAKLLDEKKGGSFEFLVDDKYKITQEYLWETNILNTLFDDGENTFQVIDFMPRYMREDGSFYAPPDIIRFIRHIKGKPKFRVKYDPKLDFAMEKTYNSNQQNYIKSHTKEGKYDSLFLYSNYNLDDILEQNEIEFTSNAYFVLGYNEKLIPQSLDRAYLKFQRTKTYWMNWSAKTTHYKNYNDIIMRSALVLKSLSYEKSGAVLAAVTTSLPETIGEERNWDYRFCWIRDASMVIKVMAGLGHKNSAKDFLQFIIDIIPNKDEKIQIMYGINGEKELTEHILSHLSGYENSHPVRIGNAAYIQKQNDIYGILMEVIYQQFNQFETSLENAEELWTVVRGIVRIVEENWQKPDKGIWELRTEDRHFVFSKLLCWVAIDRAIKIGEVLRMGMNDSHWRSLRAEIYTDIYNNGWNEEVQAYTQSYGSKDMDASTLLMEQYGFIDAADPRFVSTVQATEKELCKDGLMYRYKNKDDFGEPSSSFTICTFWLIDSLYKIGEKKKAKKMFDKLISYSNHLGLFSEDLDFKTKRLLGNFPQAYSHLALIETAANFSEDDEDENAWLHEL
ncbi:Glucoamylase (glucan-1,4-alpha-glucosidase), GH15 family [Salegentibacter echinorum]|uniref:Glucoamylase (Glucan-1,4-alpha-glucosidase), GH15 family n=1 Tax=Salegentibacter echinorum TaxID=1073325 RepID=A0A1M5CFT5_SALEC|nr:glycoside hydrolase family 15 protein [Salegentibacter echinorum]SHF53605.1 Glucoamylase (glucan-1,4-alpha-glucosidase), GH15 family [Salegentibacter echinorum]